MNLLVHRTGSERESGCPMQFLLVSDNRTGVKIQPSSYLTCLLTGAVAFICNLSKRLLLHLCSSHMEFYNWKFTPRDYTCTLTYHKVLNTCVCTQRKFTLVLISNKEGLSTYTPNHCICTPLKWDSILVLTLRDYTCTPTYNKGLNTCDCTQKEHTLVLTSNKGLSTHTAYHCICTPLKWDSHQRTTHVLLPITRDSTLLFELKESVHLYSNPTGRDYPLTLLTSDRTLNLHSYTQ